MNSLDMELQSLQNTQKSLSDFGWQETSGNFTWSDTNNPNNQLDNLLRQQVFNRSNSAELANELVHKRENQQLGVELMNCIRAGVTGPALFVHLTNCFGPELVQSHIKFITNFENAMRFGNKTENAPLTYNFGVHVGETEVPVEITETQKDLDAELTECKTAGDFDITQQVLLAAGDITGDNGISSLDDHLKANVTASQDTIMLAAGDISENVVLSNFDEHLQVTGGTPPKQLMIDVYPVSNPTGDDFFKDNGEELKVEVDPQAKTEGLGVVLDDSQLDVTV